MDGMNGTSVIQSDSVQDALVIPLAQSMKMKRVHMSIVWTKQIRKASFTSPPVFLLPEPDQHEESAEEMSFILAFRCIKKAAMV